MLIEDIAGSGMFVTLAAVRISAQQPRMDFAGAGHPPVMVVRRGQRPLLLESRCGFSAYSQKPRTFAPAWRCRSNRTIASSCTPTGLPKSSIPEVKCSALKAFEKLYTKHQPCLPGR